MVKKYFHEEWGERRIKEEVKKCWELNIRPREVCRKCPAYINKVHCWEAPLNNPRSCIRNYHLCVERKCPIFDRYKHRIMKTIRVGSRTKAKWERQEKS